MANEELVIRKNSLIHLKKIFMVDLSIDKKSLEFQEDCDNYYEQDLNKSEALELTAALLDLISQMEESE